MENVIEFPWYRNRSGSVLDYDERFATQKELFFENFIAQAIHAIAVTKQKPANILRVVDEEDIRNALSCYPCWPITKRAMVMHRPSPIGSDEPTIPYNSYRGLALTKRHLLFEYVALDENLLKDEVIHVAGRHLVDEIPDRYIQASVDTSAELILGLSKISSIEPRFYETFAGLSSVK